MLHITPRLLAYLSVSIITSVLFLWILDQKRFSKLAESSWNNRWLKTIGFLSQVLILILILDETGLLLEEWNIKNTFLSLFRKIMEIPGFSILILLANIGLVVPAAYTLSSGLIDQIRGENKNLLQTWNDYDQYKREYSLFFSFFVLSVTILVFYLQCLMFGEFSLPNINPFSDLIYISLIFAGPVAVLYKLIAIEKKISRRHNPFWNQPFFEAHKYFAFLMLAFLSLTQTMITKVILLLLLVSIMRPSILKLLHIFRIKTGVHEFPELQNAFERVTTGLSGRSLWHKWNFIFLTTSFFPLILLYQSHNSPFPPSNSAFPKTETITMLYMIYMILFLFIGRKSKFLWLKSVLWTVSAIFIIYLTPILFHSWYFPSLDPPGFSTLEVLSDLSSTVYASLFFFTIHLVASVISFTGYYLITVKSKLISTGYKPTELFKKYFFLKVFTFDLFSFTIFPLFMLFLSTSIIYRILKFYEISGLSENKNAGSVALVIFIMGTLFYLSRTKEILKRIREINNETVQFGGEEAATRIKNSFTILKAFKSWNAKGHLGYRLLFFLVPVLLFIGILMGCIYLPWELESKRTSLAWVFPEQSEKLSEYTYLDQIKDKLYFRKSDKLYCIDPNTGKSDWARSLGDIYRIELMPNNNLIILTGSGIFSIKSETGYINWRSVITGKLAFQNIKTQMQVNGNTVLLEDLNRIKILDVETGRTRNVINHIKNTKIKNQDGGFCWITDANILQRLDKEDQIESLYSFQDSIIEMVSEGDRIYAHSKKSLYCFQDSLLWKMTSTPEDGNISKIKLYDGVVAVKYDSLIMAINTLNGKVLWKMQSEGFAGFGYNAYSSDWSLNSSEFASGKLMISAGNDLFIVDPLSGSVIKTYRNIFVSSNKGWDRHICFGVSGKHLISFGETMVETYPIDGGRKLSSKLYLKKVFSHDPEYYYGNPKRMLFTFNLICCNGNVFLSNSYGLFALKLK